MSRLNSVLTEVLQQAHKEILKESKIDKVKIIKLAKYLIMNGVSKEKLEPIVDKYKYIDRIEDSVIKKTTYEEFESILLKIAEEAGITVPSDIDATETKIEA